MFLAVGSFFGIVLNDWAAGLGVFLFGLNMALMGLMAFYMSGRLRAVAVTGAMALGGVAFVRAHAAMLSEALFFVLMCSALWGLIHYRRTRALPWLMTAAFLSALWREGDAVIFMSRVPQGGR